MIGSFRSSQGHRAAMGAWFAIVGHCFLASPNQGCRSEDVTQLVISVDTDFARPGELDQLVVTVLGPSGASNMTTEFLAASDSFPRTLSIVPADRTLGPVEITVTGQLEGNKVIEKVSRVTLVAGKSLLLRMFLVKSCLDVQCDETCDERGCVAIGVDSLDPWTGQAPTLSPEGDPCLHDDECDNGIFCDGEETCIQGRCSPGATVTCDDGVSCTVDVCDESAGACSFTPDDGLCTAGQAPRCDPVSDCQYASCNTENCFDRPELCETAKCEGTLCVRTKSYNPATQFCCAGNVATLGCDDSNPCTNDVCGSSGCEHTVNSNPCDDGDACTAQDVCFNGTCSGSPIGCFDGNECTTDSCDSATGCVFSNRTGSCTGSNACLTGDMCSNGVCVEGNQALDCNDGNSCTNDSCNTSSGCVNAARANGSSCNDNNPCTLGDMCQSGSCVASSNVLCPSMCVCNTSTGMCVSTTGGTCTQM